MSEQLTLYGEPGWRYDERAPRYSPSTALEHGRTMAELEDGSTGPEDGSGPLCATEGAEGCRSSGST